MKKSSSSSSLPKQRRRNRSRSSSSNNHRHGNNNGNSNNMKSTSNNNTRGQSPRPNNNNRQNSLRNGNRSRSNNSSRRNNNSADDDKQHRFYKQPSNGGTIHRQEKPKSISRSKLHMPHIIPNISPSVLLNKKQSNDTKNGRGKSHDDGGRRRRGRSSTPKTRGEADGNSFSNTLRRSLSSGNRKSLSNNNSTSRKRSAFRLRSFSTGDRSAKNNNLRRSRSASFQHRQHQHYDNDDNYNGRRRSMSSGRMNNSSSSNTKPSWMTTDRSNRNDTNQRKRRRGKSMPARFLDNMPTLGFWKGNANNNHANNRWNTKKQDREEKKIKQQQTMNNQHLEASFPELQKEMKRLSSSRSSRERGRKSSLNPSGANNNTTAAAGSSNEWGAKPRGRSRPKHTSRNRSDTNKDQIKDLEAEVATIPMQKQPASVLTDPPPPPPPPRFPPPPFHHSQQQQQSTTNDIAIKNNHGNNYNRSKSLPRNFQRYSLLDVMVEMEKEIEVPLRKKYSHCNSSGSGKGGTSRADFDSVISPIASMDSSWRYKEDIFLMKSMASLSASRRGRGRGRGSGGVPSTTTTRMKSGGGGFDTDGRYDDPRMSHGISSRQHQQQQQQQQQPLQPAPAPIRAPPPPPLKPPASTRIVGDINDIDGDDDEEEEEDVIDFNDIDGDDDEEEDEKEDNIDTPIPRRPKSAPPRVEEEEEEPSQVISEMISENDENDTNATNSEKTDDKSTASKEEKTQVSESLRTNDDFTFRSSIVRPEPISSVYGSSATESPEVPTNHVAKKDSSSQDSDSAGGGSSSSSGGEGDSLIGYASFASDEKVGSIAPPPHSSIRRKKPGAISVGPSPIGDRSSATHSMGTLSRMHNELQRKMSELQDGLDEHGRPVKELDLDLTSMDSSTGRVSDLTLPTVLMKAPPPASRIRAMKPKPLTTRRTKKGTLELQGDIDAMKSLAVSELSMSSPVQSAYPKSMSMRMTSYKKTVNNAPSSAAATPPAPRRASAPSSRHARRNTQPKPDIAPIVESSEEHADALTKKSSTRSLHSRHSYGTAPSTGTTSQMPMKPASGAGHRHAPPPPKHRPAGTKIDIGDVAQQLQMMQGQAVSSLSFAVGQGQGGVAASSVASGNGSRSRQYTPKAGGGNSVSSSVKHSSVEGMKWSDKFGKTGRYSGDVNADYIPNGMGSMQYNFGLTVEGRWVDGTLLSNDLDQGFAV